MCAQKHTDSKRAGFWRRTGAGLIDLLLVYGIASCVIAVARLMSLRLSLELAGVITIIVGGVVFLPRWQTTPGKRLLELRLQSEKTGTVGFKAAFLREAVGKWGLGVVLPITIARLIVEGSLYYIFVLGVLLIIQLSTLIYYAFAKQTWYDQLARTSVVRLREPTTLGARRAFVIVAVVAVVTGGIKAGEFGHKGWISCNLALFNSTRSTKPYVAFLKQEHASPVDYIMGLFERYDVVVICERPHPEFTQWNLIYDVVSDPRFIDKVGNIFTEYGLRNYQPLLDEFMEMPDLNDEEVTAQAIQVMRHLSFWPTWNNTNFYEYLKKLYRLNQTLPPQKRIRHYFSDIELDWDEISSTKDFWETLHGSSRDRRMADLIIAKFGEIQASKPRKKCLVIMNYRHGFGPVRTIADKLMDNTGGHLYEAFPGKTANVLLVPLTIPLLAPVQGGVWEAAFKEVGNKPVGFDFAGSPFGKDRFDMFPWPVIKANYQYQDVFTGYVFDRPLDEQYVEQGIPGLFDGVEDVVLQRAKIVHDTTYQSAKKLVEGAEVKSRRKMFHTLFQTIMESILLALAAVGFIIATIAFLRQWSARAGG